MKTSSILRVVPLLTLLAACAGTGAATASGANGSGEATPRGIELKLSFSVAELDRSDTSSNVRCVISNESGETIRIPAEYDGRLIALVSTSHRFPLRLFSSPRPSSATAAVELGTGMERTVFDFPLWQILDGKTPANARASSTTMSWDWSAHPRPPRTPIDPAFDGKRVEEAAFHAELRVGDTVIRSNEVLLKVKH